MPILTTTEKKEYDELTSLVYAAQTVSEAKSFDYDSLENPFGRKLVLIASGGQEPKNLYVYFPQVGASIVNDSQLLIKTTTAAIPGALVRLDTSKIASTSAELTEFASLTGFLGNSWTLEYQTDDDSLQLLFGGIKQSVLYNSALDGGINADNAKIINLADPIDAQDAATKNYVDTALGDVFQIGYYLNNTSGSLTAGVWQTLSFNITPEIENNNPVTSVTGGGTEFNIPDGKYQFEGIMAISDTGPGNNNNTNAAIRILDSVVVLLPRGIAGFYTFGGEVSSIPYTHSLNFIHTITVPNDFVKMEIMVDNGNFTFATATMSFLIRKIG